MQLNSSSSMAADEDEAVNSLHSSPSPPNLSFRVLESTAGCRFPFGRSISHKEQTTSDFPTAAEVADPPRLSFSHVQHHLAFPVGSYPPASTAATQRLANGFNGGCSYRFISSVLKKDGQILSMALSNNLVYVGSERNAIRVYKLPELIECDRIKTKTCRIVALLTPRLSNYVYAAYSDNNIRVWRRTLNGGVKHVRVATVPKSSGYVRGYIGGKDRTQTKHMGPITSMSIDVAGDILYSASVDTTVKVWRISDLRCLETFKAHQEPVNAIVAASSDGILYTASDDATVRVWHRRHSSTSGHSLSLTLPAKNSPVKALALAPPGDTLYGGCTDGYIHYWVKAKGSTFACQMLYGGALQGHEHAVLCMAHTGEYLVSGSADSTVRIWSKKVDVGHECVGVMVAHRGPVRCVVAYSEHGEDGSDRGCTICTGSLDGALKQWRVASTTDCGSHGAAKISGKLDYFEI